MAVCRDAHRVARQSVPEQDSIEANRNGQDGTDPDRLLELQPGESYAPAEDGLSSLEFSINPERIAPALRRLISGGPVGPVWQGVAVLAAFTVGALALTAVSARRKQVWTLDRLHPELSL